jgi:hypothetical protein
VFTRCYLLNIERRTHLVHKIFKEMVCFVKVFAEFLTPLFRIFTQQRQSALVLTRRVQLNVNFLLFRKRLKFGICATTPMEPIMENGAATILSATQAII